MRAVLDALFALGLLALSWQKLTGAAWDRFPYDAPARFVTADLLALACAALLLLRWRLFPGEAPHPLEKAGGRLRRAWERSSPRWTLLLCLAAFFGFHFAVHLLRHWSFKTELFDQSSIHTALFWPWDRRPLSSDILGGGTFLSAHLAFSLFVLTPLTAFLHVDELVFFLQALVIAAPLWAVIRYGPLRDRERGWVPAFALVACHCALRNGLIWDLREDCLAFGFLLLAMLSLRHGRVLAYFLSLALAALSKEHVAGITLFLALPVLFQRDLPLSRRKRMAIAAATVILSAGWLFAVFALLIPHWSAGGGASHDMVRYFPGAGATPGAVLTHYLASPRALLADVSARLLTAEALTYLSFLLLPFGYFLRRGGWWLAPALPGIVMNLLAERPYLRSLAFHYDWVVLPFLIMGLLEGIRRFSDEKGGAGTRAWACALLLAFAFSGSWPLQRYYREFWPSRAQVREVWYLRRIPNEGTLGVGWNSATPHLSRIREIRLFNDVIYGSAGDREGLWREIWDLNRQDETGLPGHGAIEADRLLLDLQTPMEYFLASEAPRRGWKVVSRSPGGRFLYLRRN